MAIEPALKRPAALPESDESLVARVVAGDQKAFSSLYRRHARYVAGVAYRLLGEPSELDDVVQETFLLCLQKLGRLEQPERLRSWLVTIAVRRVHRRLSARNRRRWLGAELIVTAPPHSDPQVSREVHELYAALDGLAPELRLPWTLSRIEGGSLEEVAEWCQVSLATVKRRLARADEFVKRRVSRG